MWEGVELGTGEQTGGRTGGVGGLEGGYRGRILETRDYLDLRDEGAGLSGGWQALSALAPDPRRWDPESQVLGV